MTTATQPPSEFAAAHGCISAVEIHDRPSQQSASLERGDSKTQPERQILNELALFAGAGGGILGGKLLGWRTVCAVEINEYARRVLLSRQDDGSLDAFPVWDDIRTFDGLPWCGLVDVISGGFPCQDISAAGKGVGIEGSRSGLWGEMARIIGEVGPRFVLVENSPNLTSRGLGRVLSDLAALGYDAQWGVLGAVHAGAPHKRERIWIVANSSGGRCSGQKSEQIQLTGRAEAVRASEAVADSNSGHEHGRRGAVQVGRKWSAGETQDDDLRSGIEWCPEPGMGRVAYGVANRVDRLTAIGNGQVPRVVALAWRLLSEGSRLLGMRVGLPKGEAVASEGRKYNAKLCNSPEAARPQGEKGTGSK